MNGKQGKCLVVLVCIFFSLAWSSGVLAGIVIEDFSPQLNGTKGKITKIEGNVLTLLTASGTPITLKVNGLMANGKAKLKVGDRVRIGDGEIAGDLTLKPGQKVHFDPQPEPPGMGAPGQTIQGVQ